MLDVPHRKDALAANVEIYVADNYYRFLWLKYPVGFDASQHCAKCLVGGWSKLIHFGPDKARLHRWGDGNEFPDAGWLYLCGVSDQYKNNLHVAMRRQPGVMTEGENAHIYYRFIGWEQVEIPKIPAAERRGYTEEFYTCRNFQFGWKYLPRMRNPNAKPRVGAPPIRGEQKRAALLPESSLEEPEPDLFATPESLAQNGDWQEMKRKLAQPD